MHQSARVARPGNPALAPAVWSDVEAIRIGRLTPIQQRAERLSGRVFLGGPVEDFDRVGRACLITLLSAGLLPHSKVLDVGCGCLRAGYWLLHFLDPGCYFGIEPDERMLDAGLRDIVEPEVLGRARASFAPNSDFDFTVFGERFDFVLARSVWTHASKAQIGAMLDSFVAVAAPGGSLLASYLPARRLAPAGGRTGPLAWWARDYDGHEWVGHSHERRKGGLVAHSKAWIRAAALARGLTVRSLKGGVINHQRWLQITRPERR